MARSNKITVAMPQTERNTFPRSHRLGGQREFAEVFDARVRVSRGFLTVFAKPNGKKHNRLGLSVSRKIGSAVLRNRIKRLLREAYRLTRHELPSGYDLGIVPRGEQPWTLEECQKSLVAATRKLHEVFLSRT
jgi:ribonuclease P protein component